MANIFHMDCNNGGDYVVIEEVSKGMCHIEIGHACVVMFDNVVPIEWLTGVFSGILKSIFTVENNDALTLYDKFADWQEPFKSEVRNKLCQPPL